jgi:GMP synthase-like glutamine amidotransferase
MKPKILSIQFRKSDIAVLKERESIEREIGAAAEVTFVNALYSELDWNYPETIMEKYDGVILGGSGDFDFDANRDENDEARKVSYELLGKLRPLFTYIFDHDVPTLGICFGHQLLGAFAGAQVTYDEQQKKTSSHTLHLLVDKNDFFLFSDLPDSFCAQYAHNDALDRVPKGATLLMNGGDACRVSALCYQNNIFTTQFHPELTLEDMLERANRLPGYLPEGAVIEEIFEETPHANTILKNFGKMVAMHTADSTNKTIAV